MVPSLPMSCTYELNQCNSLVSLIIEHEFTWCTFLSETHWTNAELTRREEAKCSNLPTLGLVRTAADQIVTFDR